MDKVLMVDTLTQLQEELTKRLTTEEQSSNKTERVAEYKNQLKQIQAELARIAKEKSYTKD